MSPPVVAVLAGAILASEKTEAPGDLGITAAVGLALEATTPRRRQLLECRLGVKTLQRPSKHRHLCFEHGL